MAKRGNYEVADFADSFKFRGISRQFSKKYLKCEIQECSVVLKKLNIVCSNTCHFYSSFDMKDESREENWPNVKVSPPCIHHAQLELNSTFNCSLCV